MLTEEKIQKNATKFFKTAETNGFMTEELMNYLGVDFINAPASQLSSQNNSFTGGLIEHLLTIAKYGIILNDNLPPQLKQDKSQILKVCLLSQIGKARMFTPCKSEWHIKNQGKNYEFLDDSTSIKTGEKSVFYAINNGVKLAIEEYQAIINNDKDDSDKQSKYHNSTLGNILKIATQLAVMEEKSNTQLASIKEKNTINE